MGKSKIKGLSITEVSLPHEDANENESTLWLSIFRDVVPMLWACSL